MTEDLLLQLHTHDLRCRQQWLRAVCKNSIDNDDPKCFNGGYLQAQNTTEQTNCAVCVCPNGWRGVDCSGKVHAGVWPAVTCITRVILSCDHLLIMQLAIPLQPFLVSRDMHLSLSAAGIHHSQSLV